MNESWGRDDAGAWQNPKPVWTVAMLVVALLSSLAIGALEYAARWTPLQRLYLSTYLRSAIAATLTRSGRYELLMALDQRGTHL